MRETPSRRDVLSGVAGTVASAGVIGGLGGVANATADGEHTLVLEAGRGYEAEYEFEVEADLSGVSPSTGSVDGTAATGQLHGREQHAYSYDGSLERFAAIADHAYQLRGLTVTLDGTAIDPRAHVDRHTLTVTSEDGSPREYDFVAAGGLEQVGTLGASRNATDAITDGRATGAVSVGRDSYEFGGGVSRLNATGATFFLDGSHFDPWTAVDRHTITVASPDGESRRYEFEVEADLRPSDALGGTTDEHDVVDGTRAAGSVAGGRDSYTYEQPNGDADRRYVLEQFNAEEATVYVDGTAYGPNYMIEMVKRHTVTIESPDEQTRAYELTVDDGYDEPQLRQSEALGASINDHDRIDDSHRASGTVAAGRDSYTTAAIPDVYEMNDDLTVYLDGWTRD